jgi:hypothetical protein
MWGYHWVPLLFIVASAVVAANQVAADPLNAGAGLALVVLGLPVYYIWVRKHANH